MEPADYKKMAENIRAELESLEIQQETTERRIARLRQALIGLVPLAQEFLNYSGELATLSAELDAMSITDAARQILQASKTPLAPLEIKQQLVNMGKDLSDQKNVMAGIHSLLKRLLRNEEIETKDNGLTYEWKGIRRFPRTYVDMMQAQRETEQAIPPPSGHGLTPPPRLNPELAKKK
jgi:hypothetical protein